MILLRNTTNLRTRLHEVPENGKAIVTGTFGMELDACNPPGPYDGCKHIGSAGRGAGDRGSFRWSHGEAVHEVEGVARGNARQQRFPFALDLVPSHVREWGCVEPLHRAWDEAEAGVVVLVGVIEQQLHADAHSEQRAVVGHHRFDETPLCQGSHRRTGRADTREHNAIKDREISPSVNAHRLGIDPSQCLFHGDEVARTMVDQRNTSHSTPFVEATPERRGSNATASRIARASALNIASAMWWSLRPVASM